MSIDRCTDMEAEQLRSHHLHHPTENQCSSFIIKYIKAPVHFVWSLVRRFDEPQKYKPFVTDCVMLGSVEVGNVRQVYVTSGLPATRSTERLTRLDENEHILSMSIVGGDHRLHNYSSTISLHPHIVDGKQGTMAIESFVVDVPEGNTEEETCYFVRNFIRYNLLSLSLISEQLAHEEQTARRDRDRQRRADRDRQRRANRRR